MSKISFISDTHAYRHKGMPSRLDDCLECLKWAIKESQDRGVEHIVHLGDVFHDRTKIHVLAYEQVFEILSSAKMQFTILVGNHDMWYLDRRDITSIKPFSAMPNVEIISEPTTKNIAGLDIDFAPYSRDPFSVLSKFKKKSRLLCGHLAVDGAFLNIAKGTKAEVEIESDGDMIVVDSKHFKGWEQVFLGHYHGAQVIDGFVEYVGSLMQLTWNEATQEKHMIVLDTETFQKEYVVNNFSPKHIFVTDSNFRDYDLNNNFVCVQIDSFETTDTMGLKSLITEKFKPLEFSIEEIPKTSFVDDMQLKQELFNATNGDTLKRFMDTTGIDTLDSDLLYEIGQNIIGGE